MESYVSCLLLGYYSSLVLSTPHHRPTSATATMLITVSTQDRNIVSGMVLPELSSVLTDVVAELGGSITVFSVRRLGEY